MDELSLQAYAENAGVFSSPCPHTTTMCFGLGDGIWHTNTKRSCAAMAIAVQYSFLQYQGGFGALWSGMHGA